MLLVQNGIECNGCVYSLDMIRLSFHLKHGGAYEDKYIKQFFNYLNSDTVSNLGEWYYTTSRGANKYKHMWTFKTKAYVVKMLYSLNSSQDFKYYGYIEFNPNKVPVSFIRGFMHGMLDFIKIYDGKAFKLCTFDIAIDLINVDRDDVVLAKDRRSYRYVDSRGSRTEYLGQHHERGFVKIYDKQKESGLNYPCTRIELTYDETLEMNYPDIYYRENQKEINFGLSNTQAVLLELLERLDEADMKRYWRRLNHSMQDKLRPYLWKSKYRFEFDMESIVKVYKYAVSFCDLSMPVDLEKERVYFMHNGYYISRKNQRSFLWDYEYWQTLTPEEQAKFDDFHEPETEEEVYLYENAFSDSK